MSLKEVIKNLKEKNETLTGRVESENILSDFMKPCFENSTKYDRGVGYFTSSVFELYGNNLIQFIRNGGKIRLACSHHLLERDIYEIEDAIIHQDNFIKDFNKLLNDIKYKDSAEILASLVSHKIMDIRIIVPKSRKGQPDFNRLFHPKLGIFSDGKNSISFEGSANESKNSLTSIVWDTIKYHLSWEEHLESVKNDQEFFDKIWNNEHDSLKSFKLTEETIASLKKYSSKNEKELVEKVIKLEEGSSKNLNKNSKNENERFKLRTHQEKVLENWLKNKKGIIKHATGSGKTYTALNAIEKILCADNNKKIPLIIVPQKLLAYQWQEEIEKFFKNDKPKILNINSKKKNWPKLLLNFSKPDSNSKIIISTDASVRSNKFLDNIYDDDGLDFFLIADEVHQMGSAENKKFLEKINPKYRLGLSATPERYMDSAGTDFLLDYFGGILEPEFSLNDALKARPPILSDYYYHFSEVYFTAYEEDEFARITYEIRKLYPKIKNFKESSTGWKKFKNLLIERANLSKTAENKTNKAFEILKEEYNPTKKQFWLVYCNDNNHINNLKNRINSEIEGANPFIYTSEKDYNHTTLEYFKNNGGIILAVKMLDQGIDIPQIDHALFISSSRNEREFIQRRGRVLRRHKEKIFSRIFDSIVLPSDYYIEDDSSEDENYQNIFLSHIKFELVRSFEFASAAKNSAEKEKIKSIAKKYNIDIDVINDNDFGNVELDN